MPLVGVLQSTHDFAAAGVHIAGFPFQRLNGWLLVDAEYDGVLRWAQVQPDNVRSLRGELGISAYAPRAMAPKLDAFLAKHAPHGIVRNVECKRFL